MGYSSENTIDMEWNTMEQGGVHRLIYELLNWSYWS